MVAGHPVLRPTKYAIRLGARFADYADEDVEGGYPCRIAITLRVQGDQLELDYTGSDPQLASSLNMPTGGRERRSSTHVRGRRREKEEGADRLACPGRRGGLGGHKGKALGGQKPRAGRGYSALVHCSALQSTHMAGIGIFLAPRAWPLVSRGSG